ncbi:hypothetical protein FKW77_006525 [Venturia effusa]|uniref:Ubiquitin-like domain-containing protein n=1 Tax=Venturia effusa TaxID=50376 RepID=A0A517LB01_9PEZI|nr:hypothetical protein FKW77_006525 [Venturia effusa]
MKTKPQWLIDQEAAKKAARSEAAPENKKLEVKDATDMFSRSKDFKPTQTPTRAKEEIKKEKKVKIVKEEGRKSKRRRNSTEEEEERAGASARKKSLTPSKRSLTLRPSGSRSPPSLTKRSDAVTSVAVKPKKAPVIVSLDSDDDDDDESLYKPPPQRPPVKKLEPKQQPTPTQDDESDIDSDEEFPELVRNAKAKAKQQELERLRRSSELQRADGTSESPAVEEGPNPPIKIFIDPRIPDTQPLVVTRKWNQRFREVRNAWCERQSFVADFAETVIFTWKGIRIFDVASCKSLGIKLNEDGEPYLPGSDGIDEDMSQIVLVATTLAIVEQEKKAAAEEEKRKEDQSNGITAGPPAAPEKKKVKIMLNAKDYPTHKLIVQEDTTFERIAHNFRRVHKVPDDKQITLMWDGEPLEPSNVVRDTEIEDMESIEVHIK